MIFENVSGADFWGLLLLLEITEWIASSPLANIWDPGFHPLLSWGVIHFLKSLFSSLSVPSYTILQYFLHFSGKKKSHTLYRLKANALFGNSASLSLELRATQN